jgi:hypothetical protein
LFSGNNWHFSRFSESPGLRMVGHGVVKTKLYACDTKRMIREYLIKAWERDPSDGRCQRENDIDDHLLPCHKFFERELLNDRPC